MDYRRLSGLSIDDIEEEIDNITDDEIYGCIEKTSEFKIKNDINRKKNFKHHE